MFINTGLNEIKFPRADNILTIENTFQNCTNLVTVDLSNLKLNDTNSWLETFSNCSKLQTIYVADNFINKSVSSRNTFYNCTSLVGGAGTKYDPTFIDSTAARIDGGPSNPGYFTAISDKPLETTQTNESDMSDTTANEIRNVEAPVKEPNELETDSKQNESESQQ